MSTLDNFKKEAKRWLKALRANDRQARERLLECLPTGAAPIRGFAMFSMRSHASMGIESWIALKTALAARQRSRRRRR